MISLLELDLEHEITQLPGLTILPVDCMNLRTWFSLPRSLSKQGHNREFEYEHDNDETVKTWTR